MSEQDTAGLTQDFDFVEAAQQHRAEFDLGDWMQNKSTMGAFTKTIFVDVLTGQRLAESEERLEVIASDIKTLQERVIDGRKNAVVGIAEEDSESTDAINALKAEQAALLPHVESLRESLRASSLTFHFRTLRQSEADKVRKQVLAEHNLKEGDEVPQEVAIEMMHRVTPIAVTEIVNGEGQSTKKITPAAFDELMDVLLPTERMKLADAGNRVLFVGNVFKNLTDAGFPGGRADVAE